MLLLLFAYPAMATELPLIATIVIRTAVNMAVEIFLFTLFIIFYPPSTATYHPAACISL
jgi:hypothetical protein